MGSYTKADIKEMKRMLRKTKDTVMYRKYQAILLHMKGYSNTKIAELVGVERKTVGRYVQKFTEGGTGSLVPKKSSGRPRLLDKRQEHELYITISNNTPEDVGFDGVKNWTAKIAGEWIFRTFGVRYTVNGVLEMFHRLNLSYTRPTYVLAKADPEKQAKFMDDFEVIKKTPTWQH